MKCSPGISNFLEEISGLSRYVIFLYFLASITEKGFLLAILWSSAFKWVYLSFSPLPFVSLLFTAICKASSESHFAFLHFFFLGMVLILVSRTMSQTSTHRSSGTQKVQGVKNLPLISVSSPFVPLFGGNQSHVFPLRHKLWLFPPFYANGVIHTVLQVAFFFLFI